MCRCRATLEYLPHGHIEYLDFNVCIGPKTDEKEWHTRRQAMKQEVSILNGQLAGEKSYLTRTMTS